MRRLTCLLAALAVAAGPVLATAHAAMADDKHGGRHEQGEGAGRGGQGMGRIFGGGGGRDRGGPAYRGGDGYRGPEYRPQEYRPQEYRQPEYRQEPREYRQPEYRPQDYRSEDPRYGYRGQAYAPPSQRADPRYDPRAYGAPPSAYNAAPRRGGYMGPEGAPVVGDYAAKRLRAPPPGYDWMQTPRGYALVSRSTHQVFDVVPY